MTLIWTVASRHCVVHVSDRLVTWSTGGVANPAANKNVVYYGPDCLATIGFTGLAALEGKPTDRWIAEAILGSTLDPGMHIGPIPGARLLRLSDLVHGLRGSLSDLFGGVERKHRAWEHAVTVGGWRFSRSGKAWPVSLALVKPAGSDQVHVRHFLSRRRWRVGDYSITAFGTCLLADDEVEGLRLSVSASLRDPRAVADLLSEATRLVATRSPRVGGHCMCSSIPAPRGGFDAAVRLNADTAAPAPPLYYMPWIIMGDDLVVPPSELWTRDITDTPGFTFTKGFARVTSYR